MRGDVRSRRLVVVPDSVVNPASGDPDRLGSLAAEGWGVVALPPARSEAWLDAIVEEVVVFLDDGYEVAIAPADDAAVAEFRRALRATGRDVTRELDLAL
jgi:hypothetical protein